MHYLFTLILIFVSFDSWAGNFENLNWDQITKLEFKETNSNIKILNSTQNFSKFINLKKCSTLELKKITIKNKLALLESQCSGETTITALETAYSYSTLIAIKEIPKGTEITNKNAAFGEVTSKRKPSRPNLNQRIIARKNIKEGVIISKRNTKKAPDIFEGETITVVENGKNFKIVKKITALESGYIGDNITILDKIEKTGTITLENNETSVKILK